MFLETMPLSSVRLADLERLIVDGVPESRTLDYKREPGTASDRDKKEFLKDVTAFANTSGGHLIIGMREVDTLPVEISPITSISIDDLKLRLGGLLRDGVEPGLLGVEMEAIPVEEGFVLVIRVPRSWNPPHRVTLQNHNQFYLRHSSGADMMDVEQLRGVFLNASTLQTRLRQLRSERVGLVKAGGGPGPVTGPGFALLHIIPVGGIARDLNVTDRTIEPPLLRPREAAARSSRVNFDGLLTSTADVGHGVFQYTQVFRDGLVEIAQGMMTWKQTYMRSPRLRYPELADGIVEMLPHYINMLGEAGFGPPFYIFLSLIDVAGATLYNDRFGGVASIPMDDLLLDPIQVSSSALTGSWQEILRSTFDRIWQTVGVPRSPDFDPATGLWMPNVELRR